MTLWTVESRNLVKVVEAEDQWEAYDSLRDEDPLELGLLVIATPQGDSDDSRAIRTSMLLGQRWGDSETAKLFIQAAMRRGLPDTSEADIEYP